MRVGARPVEGTKGMVELLVDGKVVKEVRCHPGSARVSNGMVEFTATVQARPYKPSQPAARKVAGVEIPVVEEKNENNG